MLDEDGTLQNEMRGPSSLMLMAVNVLHFMKNSEVLMSSLIM